MGWAVLAKRHENITKTQKLAKSSCVFVAPGAIRTRGVPLRRDDERSPFCLDLMRETLVFTGFPSFSDRFASR